jgi:hypothetical protein
MNWLQAFWASFFPPAPVGFVPAYEPQHFVTVPNNDGTTRQVPLNPLYFVTFDTATWLLNKYGAAAIERVPYLGAGGPMTSDAVELWLWWADGVECNAGFLARMYTQNPEQQFPGKAERACNDIVAALRAAGPRVALRTSA